MQQRAVQIVKPTLYVPTLVHRRRSARYRMRDDDRAVRAENADEAFTIPAKRAHDLSAKTRCAAHAVAAQAGRLGIGFAERLAQALVQTFVGVEHERPRRRYAAERKATRFDKI